MSELQVEGMALKKLIKLCKKTPLPFGFNPSTKIPDCYFAMHRTKPAKMLGKDAKDEGPGEKSAFGTITVEGKLLILKCERLVPNLAKTLKKYLKSQKIMLNIEVRDANGNVQEADVEEGLPDDPELDGEDEAPVIDKEALAKRLKELRISISELEAKQAERFAKPYAKVVEMFKSGALPQCAKGAAQIEAALPKTSTKPDPALAKLAELYKQMKQQASAIADPAKRANIEKALGLAAGHIKSNKAPQAAALLAKIREAIKNAGANIPEAPPPPDPKTAKLAELLANYRRQTPRVTQDKRRLQIEAALQQAATFLKAGDLEKTSAALDKILAALKAGIAATKQQAALPDTADEKPLSGQEAKDFDIWDKVHKELSDKVDMALSKGLVVDVDKLRTDWNWAVSTAAAHKYTESMKPIPAIRKMLEAGTADGKSAFNADIPSDVKPFAESRLRWSFARSKMHTEMEKLKDMILAAVSDDEELSQEVSQNIGGLTTNLARIDAQLEDKLDQIVSEKAGEKRAEYRAEAQKIITRYRKELASDFFQDVDQNSGFGNVAILATAQTALSAIDTVLQ